MKVKTVYAFIDSQNLHLGVASQGWQLDFARFRVYLRDKYQVKKAFLFLGYVPENKPLYAKLKKYGYTLIFKPTIKDKRGKIKGNVDAELVLYTAKIEYDNYEQAVIVSGDGDFYCLLKFLLEYRKLKRLLVPNRKRYSNLLWIFRKHLDFVSSLRRKLKREDNKKGVSL